MHIAIAQLPTEIIHYIYGYIDIDTRLHIICEHCTLENIDNSDILLSPKSFNDKFQHYSIKVRNETYSLHKLLLYLRQIDIEYILQLIKKHFNTFELFQTFGTVKTQHGDGSITYLPHQSLKSILYADVTDNRIYDEKYICNLIHSNNCHPIKHSVENDIYSFRMKKKQRYISTIQYYIRESLMLIFIVIRNCQKMSFFNHTIDYKVKSACFHFLKLFLNSTMIRNSTYHIQYEKMKKEYTKKYKRIYKQMKKK